MFSFLLQILKVWGGHFSLFIIHYFFQNQNMQYSYTIFVITYKHKAWYVLLDKKLCVGLLQMGIYMGTYGHLFSAKITCSIIIEVCLKWEL